MATAVKKPPSSSTTSTSRLSSSSQSTATSTRNDLKACLEILKRLAPRVTPDLPQLSFQLAPGSFPPSSSLSSNSSSIAITSNSNNNVTSVAAAAPSSSHHKRKSRAGQDDEEGEEEGGQEREEAVRKHGAVKRRKKSISVEDEASLSSSLSDSSSSSSSASFKLADKSKASIPAKASRASPSEVKAGGTTVGDPAIATITTTTNIAPAAITTTATTTTTTAKTIPALPNFKTLSSCSSKHKRSGSTSSVASQSHSTSRAPEKEKEREKAREKDRKAKSALATSTASNNKSAPPAPLNFSSSAKNTGNASSATILSPPLPSPAISVTATGSKGNGASNNRSHARNASTVSVSALANPQNAPSPRSPDFVAPPSGIWTKDRFKRIATICREKGRALKHAGDKRMREYSSSSSSAAAAAAGGNAKSAAAGVALRHAIPVLALLEQLDAVILYAYAFWCEDQAAGYARSRQTSSASTASSATGSASTSSTLSSVDLRSNASTDNVAAAAASASGGHNNNLNASTSSKLSSSLNGSTTWKPGCIAENWKSIFGLVAFVRGRAEKMALNPPSSRSSPRLAEGLPRAMELVVAWLNMLEALILQHLTTNSSRHLNSQANRLLGAMSSSGSSTMGLSPPGGDNESIVSSDHSSTGAASTTSNPETSNFLQAFLKLQSDLERIHSLWPASQNILLHPEQSAVRNSAATASSPHSPSLSSSASSLADDLLNVVIRKGKMAYDLEPTKLDDFVIPNLPRDGEEGGLQGGGAGDGNGNGQGEAAGPKSPEDLFKDEENYFRFSWPVVLHHRNAVAHTTSFGRALLFEIAERLHIDYTSPDIEPSRD